MLESVTGAERWWVSRVSSTVARTSLAVRGNPLTVNFR